MTNPSRASWRSLGKPALLLGFATAGPGLGALLTLGLALSWSDTLRGGGAGVLLGLIALGFVGCGLWVLPTHVLSLLCGWSLGGPTGAAVALGTATAAAPLGYAVARRLVGDDVEVFIERYPRGAAVCDAVARASPGRAAVMLGLLRVSPVVPYGATNVLAAAFGVPMWAFLAGTAVGLTPRVVAVAVLGAGLEKLDFSRPGSVVWLVVGVGATVLVVAMLGWITRGVLRRFEADDVVPHESPTPAVASGGAVLNSEP